MAVEEFLQLYTKKEPGASAGSTELLEYYHRKSAEHGWPEIHQRRFGDIMKALGYTDKIKGPKGRIHYVGLRLVSS